MSQESAFLKIHGREVYATVIARSVDLDPPALPKTALTRPNAARPVKNQTVRSDRGFERLSFFLFPAIYREAMLGDLLELRAQMRKTRMSRRQIQWATALHLLDAAWRRPASFLLIQPAIRVIRWCVSLVDRLV
jgi:hypothetical protein